MSPFVFSDGLCSVLKKSDDSENVSIDKLVDHSGLVWCVVDLDEVFDRSERLGVS